MKKKTLAALAFVGVLTQIGLPAAAHHSYAMFDYSKEVTLKESTVVDWQWTSPHTWLDVLVPNGTPNPDKYSVEGANPFVLRRDGFGIGTFKPGDKVTIFMAPLKSGAKGGALLAVTLSDGKTLGKRLEDRKNLSGTSD